jgi:hypothetical protein
MEDVTDQAIAKHTREYVRKKRAADIKNRLTKDLMLYESIRGANIRSTTAQNLLGGITRMAKALSGMVEAGDGRILTGGLKMAHSNKTISTTSFK